MIATRRLVGGAAILACLALMGGIRSTTAGQNPAQPAATAQPAGENKEGIDAVRAIAAANTMIEYGLEKKSPLAIIAGVQVLAEVPSKTDEGKFTEEGVSEKATVENEKEYLLDLLKMAEGQLPGNEAIQKAAALARIKVGDLASRGTAKGSTKWEGIVNPTNTKTDKPVAVIKRTFLAGQVGTISVTRLFNSNVPLNLKLFDGSGNPVASRPGHPYQFEFRVPGGKKATDQPYRLEIRNYHTKGVQVRVDTN